MKTTETRGKISEMLSQAAVRENLSSSELIEHSLKREEGILTSDGALSVSTGTYTGRSPKDKFIVTEDRVQQQIDWGPINQPMKKEHFENLYEKVMQYLKQREIFVFNGFAGNDPSYRLPIRVINERAWQNLFARQLFVRPDETSEHDETGFTVIAAPGCKADPSEHGTRSETFVVISFEERVVLIGGTEYAGEMKKSVFSIMNYLLPQQHVLPMHCSANIGQEKDVALFFGLSGTGKTTLSADPDRRLIGDDEHGWSENGVFNIEGGCYAKCIRLSKENEPQIWNAIGHGSVLENVAVDPNSRQPDYDNGLSTENTRAAYPVDNIAGAVHSGVGPHPNTIIFLTADAFGILPPIAKLTQKQAMYHFLSGYTSKLAGTERGITEPEATFSTCFGAPFLPLKPGVYAEMLGQKLTDHETNVFLVNTGWSGGPYGTGKRMKLAYTRAMVTAAVQGRLNAAETEADPVFGLHVPLHVPEVPDTVLHPRETWEDQHAFDRQALDLARRFHKNFNRFTEVSDDIRKAGPIID